MQQLPENVIDAARAAQTKWKVPAPITLAQYALESSWGRGIPRGSNNPFGIKAVAGQPSVEVPTHEYIAGRYVLLHAHFAAYPSLAAAFDVHARLLATHTQYAPFMQAVGRGVLEDACDALTGIYATDPEYGAKLWNLICSDDLTQYGLVH